MDKDTVFSEENYSPVPAHLVDRIYRSGMRVCSFYDNFANVIPKEEKEISVNPNYCISHMVDGEGYYYYEETDYFRELKPGDAVIVIPGERQKYGGYAVGSYIEDSICFNGPTADLLFSEGIIRHGVIEIGKTRRLLPIIEKLRDVSIDSQIEAIFMLQQLLVDLHKVHHNADDSGITNSVQTLIKEICSDITRWWTVSDMALFCNISENHLRTLFRKQTGLSPKEYVDMMKMNAASELLLSSHKNISEISTVLGYTDPYHFTKRFTKIKGVSPTKFRKQNQL